MLPLPLEHLDNEWDLSGCRGKSGCHGEGGCHGGEGVMETVRALLSMGALASLVSSNTGESDRTMSIQRSVYPLCNPMLSRPRTITHEIIRDLEVSLKI